MGRYHFNDKSPNEYSFTDENLGLSTNVPDFDQDNFYYNLEDLQDPLRQTMTPFLTCSCQQYKSGATTYDTLLSNVMKKCLPPT
jgi:hypothetical protein